MGGGGAERLKNPDALHAGREEVSQTSLTIFKEPEFHRAKKKNKTKQQATGARTRVRALSLSFLKASDTRAREGL